MNISLDGVQESNSSNVSLDAYCVNFKGYRNVYPVKIIRPTNRYKYDEQQEIAQFISNLNENDINIDAAIFDNLKRSVVKDVKNHASTHPCEYCEASAKHYIDETMTRRQLTWPPETMNGRPRTITAIRRIVNDIEAGQEHLSSSYLKGIKGRSILLDQPNFDFILDIPAEYMHLSCLGIVKHMLEYTYKTGKTRTRITIRKRSDPKLFNNLIMLVRVPREFPRRVRNLDTSIYKAQEYRNVLLFFFPIVLENIPEQFKKERQLWLTLVFMIKSCVIPNEEFNNVNKETICNACELFYNLFYELFGQRNCTYSVHVLSSHLFKIRGNVPLTERSAFLFESFYAEMKKNFKPGTNSPLKQILSNTILKRSVEFHTCEKTILYTPDKKNTMENNALIYTYKNQKYDFYEIQSVEGQEFTCKKQGKFDYKTNILPNYNWKSVGIFKKGPTGTDIVKIQRNEVKGKVISVLNVLVTCPVNVLNEK